MNLSEFNSPAKLLQIINFLTRKYTLPATLLMVVFLVLFSLAGRSQAADNKSEQQEMFEMIDQLDQLDKMDFDQSVEQAQTCIINRNFQCAQSQIDRAATFAHGSDDQRILQITGQGLIAEINLVKLELQEERRIQEEQRRWQAEQRRFAEEQRRLEEEAEEEAEAEAEEYERQQQEYARRQRDDDYNSSSLNNSIIASMQNAANEISQLNSQLNRDTNAAIRQANAIAAENRRRKKVAAHRQQMSEERKARQQRAYDRQQRQLKRQRDMEQRQLKRQRDMEQRQREMQRLAEQRRDNLRQQQQARLLIKNQQASVTTSTRSTSSDNKQPNSRYGGCFEYCKGQNGKYWEKDTPAGACEKGCSFRHWQANDESTNHERAKQQCSDEYGGELYRWCINGVSHY